MNGHAQTIVVLASDSLTATTRTYSGMMSVVRKDFPNASFVQLSTAQSPPSLAHEIDSVTRLKPSLVVSVGSEATKVARQFFTKTPIVFASVLYPELSGFVAGNKGQGTPITGSSLDIPFAIQFKHFKKIIPNLKKIGVIYTTNTAPLISHASRSASDSGLTLITYQLNSEKELPAAIDSLARSCDGIWSLADENLFTPQATRFIMLNTLKLGVPVMGFSRNVVESGALFALDFDYKAIGRQAGSIVVSILNGVDPSNIPISSPDIIWFHYNERTAQHMQIVIPPELAAVAKEVYR